MHEVNVLEENILLLQPAPLRAVDRVPAAEVGDLDAVFGDQVAVDAVLGAADTRELVLVAADEPWRRGALVKFIMVEKRGGNDGRLGRARTVRRVAVAYPRSFPRIGGLVYLDDHAVGEIVGGAGGRTAAVDAFARAAVR